MQADKNSFSSMAPGGLNRTRQRLTIGMKPSREAPTNAPAKAADRSRRRRSSRCFGRASGWNRLLSHLVIASSASCGRIDYRSRRRAFVTQDELRLRKGSKSRQEIDAFEQGRTAKKAGHREIRPDAVRVSIDFEWRVAD